MPCVANRPDCFEYVDTHKHRSRLNRTECAFSKDLNFLGSRARGRSARAEIANPLSYYREIDEDSGPVPLEKVRLRSRQMCSSYGSR